MLLASLVPTSLLVFAVLVQDARVSRPQTIAPAQPESAVPAWPVWPGEGRAVRGTAEQLDGARWTFGARWIPGVEADRPKLRTTLTYRFTPTFTAGVEYNPLANDVGPIANWVAMTETDTRPALIVGTSSDRIGTSHGRAFYATFSKDLETWTGLPVAPYAGVSYGTFDDELVGIGGLRIRWSERITTTHLWDGHDLHHVIETPLGERATLGLVVVDLDGHVDVGVTFSIGF
jgi:hypothetical protein